MPGDLDTGGLARPLLFFGGKGGVGKTTLAAAVAVRAARGGERTLLVSTDPAHSVSDVLGTALGPEPTLVNPNLWAVEIDPSVEADRYIAEVKERIAEVTPPRLVAEVERQIDIARVTPGAEEAALFERFTRLIGGLGTSYGRVIIDTAPLGHTLRLLALPEHMAAWIGGLIGRRKKVTVLSRMWRNVAGAAAGSAREEDPILATLEERRARFHRTRAVVTDQRQTGFVFVLVPERLSLLETERAVRTVAKYGIPIGAVVVNRLAPEGSAGAFFDGRRMQEQERLTTIRATFAAYPVFEVPLLETDTWGPASLDRIASYLAVS
jgi:arsenite-transporting ATPase